MVKLAVCEIVADVVEMTVAPGVCSRRGTLTEDTKGLMKIKLFAIGLLALLMVGAAGPSFAGRANAAAFAAAPSAYVASAPAARPAFSFPKFDRTRFLADMGVAFWCIHHVYTKYKTGYYASGEKGRTRHIIAAGVVLFIAYNRLQAAYKRANESNSKTLHALVAPINALLGKTNSTATALKGGNFNTTSVNDLNSTTGTVGSQAGGAGYTIKDIPVGVPAGA